jgi:hypothetical protein
VQTSRWDAAVPQVTTLRFVRFTPDAAPFDDAEPIGDLLQQQHSY